MVLTVSCYFVLCCKSEPKEQEIEPVNSKTDCHPQSGRAALILGQADTTLIRNVDGVSELVTDLEKQTSAKIETSKSNELPDGMVLIPGGTFTMGAVGNLTLPREYPRHPVKVSSFYMDAHEVTNAEFREFVQATGYITIAERPIDWEELKKQVPPGTVSYTHL